MLTRETVERVATLARLKLSEAETEDLSKTLSKVLEHFEQIAQVDTEGVRPLITPTDMSMSARADTVERSIDSDKCLENAPEKVGRLFKVPPVV